MPIAIPVTWACAPSGRCAKIHFRPKNVKGHVDGRGSESRTACGICCGVDWGACGWIGVGGLCLLSIRTYKPRNIVDTERIDAVSMSDSRRAALRR